MIVRTYVILLPTVTGLGVAVWLTARSDKGKTTVAGSETVLFAVLRSSSPVVANALAVLVKRPAAAALGTTTTLTVTDELAPNEPTLATMLVPTRAMLP